MPGAKKHGNKPVVMLSPERVFYGITTPDKTSIRYTHIMSQSLYNVRKTDYFGNQSACCFKVFLRHLIRLFILSPHCQAAFEIFCIFANLTYLSSSSIWMTPSPSSHALGGAFGSRVSSLSGVVFATFPAVFSWASSKSSQSIFVV